MAGGYQAAFAGTLCLKIIFGDLLAELPDQIILQGSLLVGPPAPWIPASPIRSAGSVPAGTAATVTAVRAASTGTARAAASTAAPVPPVRVVSITIVAPVPPVRPMLRRKEALSNAAA